MLHRMSEAPLDRAEFERWRVEADRALESARRETAAGTHNWSCFLAEQSAQFALKGLLHGIGVAPWGHDMVSLGGWVADAGIAVPNQIGDAVTRLGRHYIATRYPDAHASGTASKHYSASDAEQAIADADAILAFVDSSWRMLDG
jgi:HEPN domain-containing protein